MTPAAPTAPVTPLESLEERLRATCPACGCRTVVDDDRCSSCGCSKATYGTPWIVPAKGGAKKVGP